MKVIISTKKYEKFINFIDAFTVKNGKMCYVYNIPDRYEEEFTEEIIDKKDSIKEAFDILLNV